MFDNGKMIPVGDAALFVTETGNANGDSVILLHGGLGSRNDFLPLARHLSQYCRLIAIDSRGHGRSEPGTAPLTYHQLEQDIATVLDELGMREAGIIGHSDGGIVALRLAASGASAPRFIVAVGAHGDLPSNDPTRELYQGITADEWREMFAEAVQAYEAENPAPDFDRLFEATKAMWLGLGETAYPGEAVRSISCPLLVVRGDDDFLVSRQHALELAEQVEGARLLNLPFASHTVLEDDPAPVVPAIRQLMDSVKETMVTP